MGYTMRTLLASQVKFRHILILMLIVLAYLLLQSVNLSHRWVADESWYLMPIPSISGGEFRIPVIPGFQEFWPAPPLLTYLEYLVNLLVPLNALIARLLPLAISIALICLVYGLSAALFNRNVGVLAAFYTAADNIIFLSARTVRPDIFIPFFVIGTLLALVFYMREGKGQSYLALAGFCVGMGISTHPNGFIAPLSGLILLSFYPQFYGNRVKLFLNYSLYCGLFLIPLVIWFVWFDADSGFAHFRESWLGSYGRHAESSGGLLANILAIVSSELNGRYAGFVQFPFRVHIALISVLVVVAGFTLKERNIRILSAIVVAQLLFFAFVNNSNDSVRYFSAVTPVIAIMVAFFTNRLFQPLERNYSLSSLIRPRTLSCLALLILMGVSQWAGNILFIWQNRGADYSAVVREIRELLPEGENTVYGEISFWLGLNDNRYVPFIRTSWQRAVELYQPNVVIMDDWVMVGGYNQDDYSSLRRDLQQYMATNGKLLGTVSSSFYGELKIYQVSYESESPPS